MCSLPSRHTSVAILPSFLMAQSCHQISSLSRNAWKIGLLDFWTSDIQGHSPHYKKRRFGWMFVIEIAYRQHSIIVRIIRFFREQCSRIADLARFWISMPYYIHLPLCCCNICLVWKNKIYGEISLVVTTIMGVPSMSHVKFKESAGNGQKMFHSLA